MKKYYPKTENLVYHTSHFSPPNSSITAGIMVTQFAARTYTGCTTPKARMGGSMVCDISNIIILQDLQKCCDSFSVKTFVYGLYSEP